MRYRILITSGLRLFILSLILASFTANAQEARLEVLSAAGESVEKAGYSLSYTLGETVTPTQGNRFYFATQGFHQISFQAVVIWEYDEGQIDISVYPNPYVRGLTVALPSNETFGDYSFSVYDLTFKSVANGELLSNKNQLELDQLPAGTYLLNIAKENRLIKTFRIVKSH